MMFNNHSERIDNLELAVVRLQNRVKQLEDNEDKEFVKNITKSTDYKFLVFLGEKVNKLAEALSFQWVQGESGWKKINKRGK